MTDGPGKFAPRRGVSSYGQPDALVSRVLSVVASRSSSARSKLDDGYILKLEAAILDSDRAARLAVLAEMQAAGIRWHDITDGYIPAVARRLGEMWCIDEVSFADVTIGTARLQFMLRDCTPDRAANPTSDPRAPNVLLVVREDEYHTLGAIVLAGQLRRVGISVRLMLGQSDAAVAELCARKRFDAVLVSASGSETLESLRDLVKMLRREIGKRLPIVVGGSVLDTDRDVKSFTGADHVTSDAGEAVRLCGLKVSLLETDFQLTEG